MICKHCDNYIKYVGCFILNGCVLDFKIKKDNNNNWYMDMDFIDMEDTALRRNKDRKCEDFKKCEYRKILFFRVRKRNKKVEIAKRLLYTDYE